MATEDFQQKSDVFLTWFKALPGATFHDDIEIADLRTRNAGRGIIATRDIAADTVLFTIPRKDIICAANSELVQRLPSVFANIGGGGDVGSDHGDDERSDDGSDDRSQDSWTSLILILIYEHLRGEASPWKPYLDILPATFETPMFWSSDELQQLQASPVLASIGREEADKMIRTKIVSVINENMSLFFPAGTPKIGDDDLMQLAHRMGSTIMAYAFDLEKDDAEDEGSAAEDDDGWVEDKEGRIMMGMVPMADVLNADAEFNAHINHSEAALLATALRDIKAGEEILNYYGPLSNGQLCRRYGYTTREHSRYDIAEIDWRRVLDSVLAHAEVTPEEWNQIVADRKAKGKWADEDSLIESDEKLEIERENSEPDDCGRLPPHPELALMSLFPPLLFEMLKRVESLLRKAQKGPSSRTQRYQVRYRGILDAIDAKLKEYGTTMEEDEELFKVRNIKEGDKSGAIRQRMALEVRFGEKMLLREARVCMFKELASLGLGEPVSESRDQEVQQSATGRKIKLEADQDKMDIDGKEGEKEGRASKKQRRA